MKRIILQLADGYLAHGHQNADGSWSFPAEINWRTDAQRGNSTDVAVQQVLWACYRWTGDAKYLRPLEAQVARQGPLALNVINSDAVAITGRQQWGQGVLQRMSTPGAGGPSGDDAYGLDEAWRLTGDTHYLERLYTAQTDRNRARMYMVTEGHMWSDRVELPSNELQRERLGGVAHWRNYITPGQAVSWRFDAPSTAEQVAILVPGSRPDHLRIIAYNMKAEPVTAHVTGWQVAGGRWRVRQGGDPNNDGHIDGAGESREANFEMSSSLDFTLPPHRQTVIEMDLAQAGAPVNARPDVGIGRGDVTLSGGAITVIAHSLGSAPAPAGHVVLEDASGHQLATAPTPALAAPLDLLPKTAQVRLAIPHSANLHGARVRLVLDTPEITQLNNVYALN